MDEGAGPGRWQDDLYDLLRRNTVTQFAYVPDAGHRILIDRSSATWIRPPAATGFARHS
jgi:hypothetical protein